MVSDINVQQITNHVIYLYNQLTEMSDECNFKQNYVLGESALRNFTALTALLTANLRLLRNVAPFVDNLRK